MSLLMQALKKAERAKQEQKESLKQLEEANLRHAEGASPEAPLEAGAAEAAPQAEAASDFPSLEMAFSEPEPSPPPPLSEPLGELPPQEDATSAEPALTLDMPALDLSLNTDDARDEPRLELSFAEIPAVEPAPTAEALLLTPDESLLAFAEPPPAPASAPSEPAADSRPAFSLELPSIIEPVPVVPPPLVLDQIPPPPVTVAEAPAPAVATPVMETPRPAEAPPVPPPPAPEERREPALAVSAAQEKPAAVESGAAKPAQQEIAKTVFAAKKRVPTSRMRIYGIAAGMLLGIVSGGAYYFWLEMTAASGPQIAIQPPAQPVSPPPEETAAPPQPAPAAEATAAPPGEGQGIPTPPPDKPAAAAPQRAEAPVAAPKPDNAARKPAVSAEPPAVAKPAAPKDEAAKPEAPKVEPVAVPRDSGPTGAGIRIVKSSGVALTNPLLSKAYQAFMAGDGEQALQLYQQVLRQEPRNRDALQGMAALAVQRQQPAQAAAIYNRMLENDPNDAEALAGLTALQGMSDPVQHESRLKNLLAKNPNALAAHFALGNLYFRQSRWAEAQSSFFRAYSGNPDNPDYAYNLAVSLDQLGQEKLALDYYQRAAALARHNVAAFDRAALQARIRDLTPPPGGEPK